MKGSAIRNVIEYMYVLVLILQCNSVYWHIIPIMHSVFIEAVVVFLLFILVLYFESNLHSRFFLPFIIMYYFCSLPLFVDAFKVSTIDAFFFRFLFVLPILMVYFASIKGDRNEFFSILYKYSNIVFFMSCISLMFWLSGEIFSIIKPSGGIVISWGEKTLYNYNYFIHFHGQGIRNCGVFTEAPMYNIVLCTAMCVEVFLRKKTSKIKVVIFILTILSTMSTTGQLVLMLVLLLSIFSKKRTTSTLLKVFVCFFLLIVFGFVCVLGYHILLEKMEGFSYFVRINKMMMEFNAWLDSPIFGHGHCSYIEGSSNSLTILLAEGGVYLFLLYLISFIIVPLKYKGDDNTKGYCILSIIYFLMLMITVVPYSHLSFLFIAMSMSFFSESRS